MKVFMPPEDRTLILAMLGDTPPTKHLGIGTHDQRSEVLKIKERNLFIKEKLAAYFQGQSELEIAGLNRFDQESLELEKDLLLALYGLIQGSWGDIIHLSESAGIFFSDSGIYQPGQFMAALIHDRAAESVSRLLSPYYRWSPNDARKRVKELKFLDKTEAQPSESVGKIDSMKAKVIRRTMEKELLKSPADLATNFILNCCRQLAKGSGTHSAIKRRLKAYEDLADRQVALTLNAIHKRKKVKGWEIVKGQKRMMSKYGGVASP